MRMRELFFFIRACASDLHGSKFKGKMATGSVIQRFLPTLIKNISDCVQPVSDQCFAKGLIPESVHKRVLESGGTSEDKARTLVLAEC